MKAAFSGHIAQLTFNAPHQQKQPDLTNTNPQGQRYIWWKALAAFPPYQDAQRRQDKRSAFRQCQQSRAAPIPPN